MKIFENKSVFKKLIIVLSCIIILGFCFSGSVKANDGPGGKLLKPVVDLLLGIGDGILSITHNVIFHQDEATITVDMTTKWWEIFSTIMVGIVVAVVVAAAVVLSAGAIAGAAAAIGISLSAVGAGTVLMVSATTGVVAAAVYNSNVMPDDLQLPVYAISPQEIFSNEIPLFDVDFFNPSESKDYDNTRTYTIEDRPDEINRYNYIKEKLEEEYGYNSDKVDRTNMTEENGILYSPKKYTMDTWEYNGKKYAYSYNEDKMWFCTRYDAGTKGENWEWLSWDANTSDGYGLNLEWVSSAEGAVWDDSGGTVKVKGETTTSTEGAVYTMNSTARGLQSTISNWYSILRNISLVALLSVLVYIGIRILISSTSSDKAKYKQFLVDWIIAICLLFSMHYIMALSNFIVEKVTDMLCSIKYDDGYFAILEDEDGKIKEALTEMGAYKDEISTDEGYINWKTNLLGVARLNAQMNTDATATYAGYVIIFLLLVLFTIYFIFTYLRRILYMAFLTLIAPLVALTYPIDKMNDGKAQAFDMWLKEYIFNLLIQPMHLLLYTILVSSAFELASKNMIYSIVSIAFMIPAEKLLRKFFGFEKAQTPGLLAGPAGAALTMSGLNKLMGHRPPKHGDGGKLGKNDSSLEDESKPRFSFDKEAAMIGNGGDFSEESSIPTNRNNLNNDNEEKSKVIQRTNNVEQDESMWKAFNNNGVKANTTTQDNQNSITATTIQRPKRSIRRGLQTARRQYTRSLKNKIGNSISNLHPLKTASRVALGAAGAATFGAAAGIVGLATGDPSKAFQYASTGLVGGYKLGDSVAGAAQSALDVPIDIGDEFKRGYYGSEEEYNRVKQNEYIEKIKNDSKNMAKLEKEFGIEEARYIRDNVIDDYAKDGITDIDDVMAGWKVEKEEGLDRKQVKSGIKYSNRIGQDTSKMKKDDLDKWKNTFTNEFSKNKTVIEKNLDSEKLGKKTMDTIRMVNKYKYK